MSRIFESDEKIPKEFGPPTKVPTTRLDSLLESHFESGQVIDLMSVDVEHMELDVLKSNDWTKFRPQFLCVEDHTVDVIGPTESSTVTYLIEQGYKVAAVAPPNVFFDDTAHHPIP